MLAVVIWNTTAAGPYFKLSSSQLNFYVLGATKEVEERDENVYINKGSVCRSTSSSIFSRYVTFRCDVLCTGPTPREGRSTTRSSTWMSGRFVVHPTKCRAHGVGITFSTWWGIVNDTQPDALVGRCSRVRSPLAHHSYHTLEGVFTFNLEELRNAEHSYLGDVRAWSLNIFGMTDIPSHQLPAITSLRLCLERIRV